MEEMEETRIKDAYMVVVEMVEPTRVLYVMFCPTRLVVVVVEAKSVEAVREDPVRVEKEVSERPGTLMVEALSVEIVKEPVKVEE
jgi:hypothetical protein